MHAWWAVELDALQTVFAIGEKQNMVGVRNKPHPELLNSSNDNSKVGMRACKTSVR